VNIKKLYKDPNITGEFFLKPFKQSTRLLGHEFKNFTDRTNHQSSIILKCIRIGVYFLYVAMSTLLLPAGMGIKFVAKLIPSSHQNPQPSERRDPTSQNRTTSSPIRPTVAPQISSSRQNPRPSEHREPTSQNRTTSSPIRPIVASQNQENISIAKVHPYPGDLSQDEVKEITASFEGNDRLKIAFKNFPSFSVTIRNKDIFESQAKVIVNAANTHLGGGAGIDDAIHRKGGGSYKKAHRRLKDKYQGNYTPGFAELITSGEISGRYGIDSVIVVAGPQGPLTNQKKESQLYSCYFNSLVLAHSQKKTSIAFPSISTGIFNFPKDRAAAISLRALQDFISKHPDSQLKTISIHFLRGQHELKTYRIQLDPVSS